MKNNRLGIQIPMAKPSTQDNLDIGNVDQP